MKAFRLFLPALLLLPAFGSAQVLQPKYLEYDFDTAGYGYDSPRQLGNAFFEELQGGRDLNKFFSTMQVYNYMIVQSDMGKAQTALAATEHYWKEFEAQREQYCRQLFDNIDSRHMDMSAAMLEDVRYEVQRVNDTGTMASDIEILFRYGADTYSILLDDCGQVKGKWFLMTPFILWQGIQEKEKTN